jgi:hypothetical protein
MKSKFSSTVLSKNFSDSVSGWDEAIERAKERLKEMKRSIRAFEEMRDSGMEFPAPKRKRRKSLRATQRSESGSAPSP